MDISSSDIYLHSVRTAMGSVLSEVSEKRPKKPPIYSLYLLFKKGNKSQIWKLHKLLH